MTKPLPIPQSMMLNMYCLMSLVSHFYFLQIMASLQLLRKQGLLKWVASTSLSLCLPLFMSSSYTTHSCQTHLRRHSDHDIHFILVLWRPTHCLWESHQPSLVLRAFCSTSHQFTYLISRTNCLSAAPFTPLKKPQILQLPCLVPPRQQTTSIPITSSYIISTSPTLPLQGCTSFHQVPHHLFVCVRN